MVIDQGPKSTVNLGAMKEFDTLPGSLDLSMYYMYYMRLS